MGSTIYISNTEIQDKVASNIIKLVGKNFTWDRLFLQRGKQNDADVFDFIYAFEVSEGRLIVDRHGEIKINKEYGISPLPMEKAVRFLQKHLIFEKFK